MFHKFLATASRPGSAAFTGFGGKRKWEEAGLFAGTSSPLLRRLHVGVLQIAFRDRDEIGVHDRRDGFAFQGF